MPRKLFKRWMPQPTRVKRHSALNFLGFILHDPNLFHLTRHSVSAAFFVGLFIAFLPIPGQFILSAFAALLFRCNLPITVALIWISNPLTFPIIFFFEYKIGANILMQPASEFSFSMTWDWVKQALPRIWLPLLVGAVITSLFVSCAGYLAVQWFWRWHVGRRWRVRSEQYKKKYKEKHTNK